MDGQDLAVWALEPYFGGSHQAFLEGLAAASCHELTLFTLPGRNWKWRMHGAALSLAQQAAARRCATGAWPDLFFASDMLDLPLFLASLGPAGRSVPTLLYMHENQLTYPLPTGVERDLSYGFKNLASAAVSDAVLFNSYFHRREFLQAAAGLVETMPDEIPERVVEGITERSKVVHVGCDLRRFDEHKAQGLRESEAGRWGDAAKGPLILWNQRWEYDKAPGDLFAALYRLKDAGVPFRVAVAGPNQGTPTAEFLQARETLAEHVVQWGKLQEASDYASLLWAADVVVSTALHEFFGVAVIEAIYCGCRPVLPRRLSYPEIIPHDAHADVLYDEGGLVDGLVRALASPREWSQDWQRTWVARFDWGALGHRFDQEIRDCWESAGRCPVWRTREASARRQSCDG